ncbi:MAG: Ig-like domain repeat protein, partial [Spirochaetales bacterium]|nr:Ig-like domain repeat protein [Spirochaetales bacterium]
IEPANPDGVNDWYVSVPTVVLTSTDKESFTAEVMYKLGLTGDVTYTEAFTLGEGFSSLSWYGVDNHGYREESSVASFKVDSEKPVTGLEVTGDESEPGFFNSDTVTLTLSAFDATSGLLKTSYNLDGDEGDYFTPITVSRQGEYTFTYWSTDNAGNIEEINTYNLVIDRKKPTVKLKREINQGLGIITLEGRDRLSGVKSIHYSFNGGSWMEYTGPLALPGGRHTLEYYAMDRAGNQSRTYNKRIRIPDNNGNALIDVNITGEGSLNTPGAELILNASSSYTMENIQWTVEIEDLDAELIGAGNGIGYTVPYTEDTMIIRLQAGATLIEQGYTAYGSITLLVENIQGVNWNSLERNDYYGGRTLPFDVSVYNARGEEVAGSEIVWTYTMNDELTEYPLSITDGNWNIPEMPGRIEIKGEYAETPEVTGEVLKEGYVIDINNITEASVSGVEGAEEPWYRSRVKVWLYPTGEAMCLDNIFYSINGSDYESYDHRINLNDNGTYELSWYGVMPDGTVEDTHTITIGVDREDPEADLQMTVINGDEYFSLTGTDNLSGLARLEYKLNHGERQVYTEPILITEETRRLKYRAVDVAGNTERWQRIVWRNIRTPRTWCRIEGFPDISGWYRDLPEMFMEAMSGEDIDSIRYSLNGADWEDYINALVPTADGYHTVSWIGTGSDGSVDPVQSAVVKLDREAPECSISMTVSAGEGTFELTAWDSLSGLLRVEYKLNGGPVMIYEGAVTLTPGDWVVEYRTLDRAGNVSDWSLTNSYVPAAGGE